MLKADLKQIYSYTHLAVRCKPQRPKNPRAVCTAYTGDRRRTTHEKDTAPRNFPAVRGRFNFLFKAILSNRKLCEIESKLWNLFPDLTSSNRQRQRRRENFCHITFSFPSHASYFTGISIQPTCANQINMNNRKVMKLLKQNHNYGLKS